MKRVVYATVTALCLLCCMPISVSAQNADDILSQQWEASGVSELYDRLPDETKILFETLGLDSASLDAFSRMTPQTALSALGDLVSGKADAPFSAVLMLLGTILLLAFFEALRPSVLQGETVFRAVCVLACTVPLLVPLWQTLERVQASADSASVFSLSFAPVYAATLSAGGLAASAVSYQTAMLTAAQAISLLSGSVIIPLLCVSLALGIADALDPTYRIGKAGAFVNKTAVWLLCGTLTLFVGLLSLQSVLSASADSVAGRMMRFSIAGTVPLVGGSLAEALYTVRGCLGALRGTVGGFGILCTVLIVLPTLIECIIWSFLLFFARIAAEMFSFSQLAGVIGVADGTIKTMIALLCSSALLMIVSVTVVTVSNGGVP